MIRLTSAGMQLAYCVETTAGTMPTASYTAVPEVTGAPDMYPAPNTEDVTPLAETEMVQYVALLKDFGGTMEFPCNWNDTVDTAWNDECISAYETAAESNKAMWFALIHPKTSKAVFFKGEPLVSGFGAVSANAALKGTLRIVPMGGWTMAAKPTIS